MVSVVNGVLPVVILIAFGFAIGKRGVFDASATSTFAKLVITILLPVDLFLGAIATPRSQLGNWRYDLTLAAALIGLYAVTFLVGRAVLKNDRRASAVEAVSVGFPNMAFVALPILISKVGETTGVLPVLIGNIITSVAIVPATIALLESGKAAGETRSASARQIIVDVVKAPLVWLPILGLALAVIGVNALPHWIDNTLRPVGDAAGGAALLTVGLIMSQQRVALDWNVAINTVLKVIAMPLVILALVTALGIHGADRTALLLIGVTPSATMAGMLSVRYGAYVAEAPPTLLATTALSIIGYAVVLVLTP